MDESVFAQVNSVSPILAAFNAAATVGHITRAAELLDVPQSSLSRRIRHLETELGVALFQPDGRGVALTAQGRDLHERTLDLVQALDNAVTVVRESADPDSGLIRFGFPLTLGPVSVPLLLAKFHKLAPRVRLQLVQAHGKGLVEMLGDGRLDLAIVIPAPADLQVDPLGTQPIQLYVSRNHRFADRASVSASDVASEVFIANPPSYHLRQMLDAWAADAGYSPHIAFEITEFDTIRALVAHGLGVAFLPVAETPTPDLVAIDIEGGLHRSVGLALANHPPTRPTARLRDFILDNWPIEATPPRSS